MQKKLQKVLENEKRLLSLRHESNEKTTNTASLPYQRPQARRWQVHCDVYGNYQQHSVQQQARLDSLTQKRRASEV